MGPLLFVLYINDLVNCLPNTVTSKLFADDLKLYSELKGTADCLNIDDALTRLSDYAKAWQLIISFSKSYFIDISSSRHISFDQVCCIDNVELARVVELRDLGVGIDQRLTFSGHVTATVARARQRMALLLRVFMKKDPHHLMMGFKSFVLPLLDYCSQVWSPHLVKDIVLIESVQRSFTKRIPGLRDFSYMDRLTKLGIITLERRRLESDLILCFKILNGLTCGPPEAFGLHLSDRRSRGHSLKLIIEHTKIDTRKYYFANRVSKPWNSLPDELITSVNVHQFRVNLKQINLDKYLIIK